MHGHRRSARQAFRQFAHFSVPAGEMGVTRRCAPHVRWRPGKPRAAPRPAPWPGAGPGEARFRGGLRPAGHRGLHLRQQQALRLGLAHAEQVEPGHAGQQARPPALLDPDWQQLPLRPVRVRGPRGLPLGAPVHRFQVVVGQDGNRPLRALGPVLHPADPVAARHEIPRLHEDLVARLFKHPRDPHRPCPVSLRVRDEEIPLLVPASVPACIHTATIPHQTRPIHPKPVSGRISCAAARHDPRWPCGA